MTDFANFREQYVSHVYDTRIKMPQDILACSQLMNHVVVRYCEKSKKEIKKEKTKGTGKWGPIFFSEN